MYTQCPECMTVFAVDETMLELSNGMVRCGRCSTQFDALRTLTDALPGEPYTSLPSRPSPPHVPRLTEAVYSPAHRESENDAAPAPSSDAPAEPSGAPAGKANASASNALTGDLPVDPNEDLTAALIAGRYGARFEYDAADDSWIAAEPAPMDYAVEVELAPGVARQNATDDTEVGWDADAETARIPSAESGAASAQETISEFATSGSVDEGDEAHAKTEPHAGDAWPESLARDGEQEVDDDPDADVETDTPEDSNATEDADAIPAPVFTRPQRPLIARANFKWVAGCAALLVLFVAQLAWANRDSVLDNPSMRPWLMRVCAALSCELPPLKDLAKLELLSRDIRPHPEVPGALMITATIRNGAAFPQPYPIVVVKLSDLDDNVVAMRRFRPEAYIQDASERAAGIAPGATVAVAIEVADPGKRAVAFHFGFQ